MSTAKNFRVSALEVTKFFLSLDPERKYFVKEKLIKKGDNSSPMIGNLRLNKLLQITQILYAAKEENWLFPEKFLAFEHGGVIYEIYRQFHFLVDSQNSTPIKNLTPALESFLTKIYHYFKTYTNQQLKDFVHEDPAWFNTWEERKTLRIQSQTMPKNSEMLKYYRNFALHIVELVELQEI
ncbi:MAG: DUF4065 domain-containing protein [Candidatus Moeniiplasma glomeromycotorum]|nr:DUF4065 domain-containing protein [Candidatus Moeniiplasma glomeromycotorum]MCE8162428.1 DUF4065 domain-containing protein [Candidatus Moeniiplasma glomeromycotorum]MCE8166354.1 DUF4065 domain-containing protein [Candidatus Moeniiplasma glomeromycotorum]MCE8166836.1 DUF4065 domain-containing protein [Candidatus Moeniiplasma glomeromycotorum]